MNPGVDTEDEIKAYWKTSGYSYDAISTKTDDPVTKKYAVTGFPTNFLIGKDGKILWRGLGFDEDSLRPLIQAAIGG